MTDKRSKKDSESSSARLGLPSTFASMVGENSVASGDNLRESYFKSETENSASVLKDRIGIISGLAVFKTRRGVAIFSSLVTLVLTLSFSSLFATNPLDTTTLAARISGGVLLSESDLADVVSKLGETVYWVGPMRGAKYTINAQNVGAIYVRYLPNAKGISDTSPNYRVIATYKEANAYDATLAAGNQPNGVSFAKEDGAGVVYYNKNTPTNVYLAYEALPFQIEVFDPLAETALAMANDSNIVQAIK
tara:strand:- start:1329 stop:2075 length:747 start_codon:yes stop_codon:yes gene_type:complete